MSNPNKTNKILIAIIAVLVVAVGGMSVALFNGKGDDDKKTTEAVTTEENIQTVATADAQKDTAEATTESQNTSSDIAVAVTSSNSWESEGKFFAQLDVQINNSGSSKLENWEVHLNAADGTVVDSSWNSDCKINGSELVIKPVDYNSVVEAGSRVGDIGLIVSASAKEDIDKLINSARLYADGKEYSSGNAVAGNTTEATTEATTEEAKDTPPKEVVAAEEGTPFENHGKLSVKGTDIVDKNGKKYQLKGLSTHGIAWFPDYVSKDTFKTFRDDWGANLIRLALYTDENGGYCTDGNKDKLKELVEKGVDAASELGMYVIVDWHILHDLNPQVYKDESKKFFEEITSKYKNYDNIIYEICNEPNGGTTWADVKSYAEEIIPIIRKNCPDAIIIVGTPTWSQDVDIAADDPVEGYDNIMYAIHFYAATHTDGIRSKVTTALSKNLPVFVSEFSICDASGNGAIDYNQAEKWFELINDNNLSYAAWNISNKNETSSLIKSDCAKTSGWSDDEISETGIWIRKKILGK